MWGRCGAVWYGQVMCGPMPRYKCRLPEGHDGACIDSRRGNEWGWTPKSNPPDEKLPDGWGSRWWGEPPERLWAARGEVRCPVTTFYMGEQRQCAEPVFHWKGQYGRGGHVLWFDWPFNPDGTAKGLRCRRSNSKSAVLLI